jgi:retron-type reverse transcriptase
MHDNLFSEIVSLDNLFKSWYEFRRGKRSKIDVQIFERKLENNLFPLHYDLRNKTYRHSDYTSFFITDPKLRHIHKAEVRDRIVHHAIYRVLYPIFDKGFIHDTYSCRLEKGTHKAVRRLESFTRKVSGNYTKSCFALKCDVKKFFDSVDHEILFSLIGRKISGPDTLWLLEEIIKSFSKSTKSANVQLGLFDLPQAIRERERERERETVPFGHCFRRERYSDRQSYQPAIC